MAKLSQKEIDQKVIERKKAKGFKEFIQTVGPNAGQRKFLLPTMVEKLPAYTVDGENVPNGGFVLASKNPQVGTPPDAMSASLKAEREEIEKAKAELEAQRKELEELAAAAKEGGAAKKNPGRPKKNSK